MDKLNPRLKAPRRMGLLLVMAVLRGTAVCGLPGAVIAPGQSRVSQAAG